jgi:hypothetical protein
MPQSDFSAAVTTDVHIKPYIDAPLPALDALQAPLRDAPRHLVTFHSGYPYAHAAERLHRQALATGWFTDVHVLHPGNRHPAMESFLKDHGEFIRRNSRGYGYWRWKPLLMKAMLEGLPEGALLYYMDAGCELSTFGSARFATLDGELAARNVLCFQTGFRELEWCKREAVEAVLGGWSEAAMSCPQIEATWFGLRNVAPVRAFIAEWASWAAEGELITDTHDPSRQHAAFREHRHDQALWSLVVKKHGFRPLPQEHCFERWLYVRDSWVLLAPVHALRSRRRRSVLDGIVAASSESDIRRNLRSPSMRLKGLLAVSRVKIRMIYMLGRMLASLRTRRAAAHLALIVGVIFALAGNADAATLVVNQAHPRASDSGPASESQPLATIGAAMKQLNPGDRVHIAAGTYREPILFPARKWAGAAETVIEGDPKGRTLIKGSAVVSDWKRVGAGRFVAPISYEPQQVFVDGEPLQQVGGTIFGGYPDVPKHPLAHLFAGKAGGIWPARVAGNRDGMPANSFHYDKSQGDVMIRVAHDALDGRVVEVAALPRLLLAEGVERVTVRNLAFEHSNTTTTTRGGAVQLDGRNVRIERVTIRRADGPCLGLNGHDHQVLSSTFAECGQMGMGGRGSGWRIDDVTVSRNNTRGFNKWWEAGGAKFVGDGGLNNSTVSRFKAIDNRGDGLWFDWKNRNNRVTDSVFASNSGFGLHVEIGEGFVLDNNTVVGNRQRGIYLRQTSSSTVAFNFVSTNGMDGIAIVDEGERDPKGEMDFSVRNNWVVGNVLAWNQNALTMPEPLADNRSDGNVIVGDWHAVQVRIGWKRTIKRPDWIAEALDANSEWRDLPKTQRPDPATVQVLEGQMAWYRELRPELRALPGPLLASLAQREPALAGRTGSLPGPGPAPTAKPGR